MPSDEELRRVAEDIRALARSLARDIHDASRAAHGSTRSATRSATENFKQGVRDATREARAELRNELRAEIDRHKSRARRARDQWWVPPSGTGTGYAPSGLAADPTGAGGYPPPAAPSWSRPPRGRRHPGPPERRLRRAVPPVRRKWDAPVVAAVIGVTLGVAWALSALGILAVSAEAVMAAALMLLGAAIVVSARTDWSMSRHAWPVFAGLGLIVGLFATSATYGVGGAITHVSIGEKTVTASQSGTYYGGIGLTTINAGQAQPGDVIDVRSLFGKTVIDPPIGETYTISGRVLAGQICAAPQVSSGVGAALGPITINGADGTAPVVIDVHQLAGQITIQGLTCERDHS